MGAKYVLHMYVGGHFDVGDKYVGGVVLELKKFILSDEFCWFDLDGLCESAGVQAPCEIYFYDPVDGTKTQLLGDNDLMSCFAKFPNLCFLKFYVLGKLDESLIDYNDYESHVTNFSEAAIEMEMKMDDDYWASINLSVIAPEHVAEEQGHVGEEHVDEEHHVTEEHVAEEQEHVGEEHHVAEEHVEDDYSRNEEMVGINYSSFVPDEDIDQESEYNPSDELGSVQST